MKKQGRFGLLVMVLILGITGGAWAGVIRVKADAKGANNGTSWANAYTDLQAALAAAEWGDEIWVAAGTYKPTSGTDRTKSIVLVAGTGLYGGFAGTETVRTARDWNTRKTSLSGDIGVTGNNTDNSYHVVIGARLAILDGFTISGGKTDPNGGGGGVYNNEVTSITVANCTFTSNTATYGGGIYAKNINAITISNCLFYNNTAGLGGGIMSVQGKAITVAKCTFFKNHSTGTGGGIGNNDTTSFTVTNCIFINNIAEGGYGGGTKSDGRAMNVTNCTYIGNTASTYGGGMCNTGTPKVTNCILWYNSALNGAEVYNFGKATFRACNIRGCGGSGAQWDTALGTDGGGNIMANPLFVDSANPAGPDGIWMTADDGLRLQAKSPCINAGTASGAPVTDILGNPRFGLLPDIGAYEFSPPRNDVVGWGNYE